MSFRVFSDEYCTEVVDFDLEPGFSQFVDLVDEKIGVLHVRAFGDFEMERSVGG